MRQPATLTTDQTAEYLRRCTAHGLYTQDHAAVQAHAPVPRDSMDPHTQVEYIMAAGALAYGDHNRNPQNVEDN